MGYHSKTILQCTQDTEGAAQPAALYERMLFAVAITGSASCAIQARQAGADWIDIETLSESGEVNLENYGWYEVRAVASDLTDASVNVAMSWR